jgi:hypothetical protein
MTRHRRLLRNMRSPARLHRRSKNRAHRRQRFAEQWLSRPAPCGIPHDDPYNPCLPERDRRGTMWCSMCGADEAVAP